MSEFLAFQTHTVEIDKTTMHPGAWQAQIHLQINNAENSLILKFDMLYLALKYLQFSF
jgi:hypothetical protein